MLPSSGYFQSIVCPFFKSGLCERPHCHFKHAKTGTVGKSQWPTSDEVVELISESSSKSDLFHIINPTPGSNLLPAEVVELSSPYVQSSKPNFGVKTSGILKTPVIKTEKTSIIPEYKPTPISRLKNTLEYKPESTIYENPVSRKRKKFEEYDPEEVKYSRKRVSFNLPNDPSIDNSESDVITLYSSEEELGPDCSAAFSDDDDDEDDNSKMVSQSSTKSNYITLEDSKPDLKPSESKEINEFSLVDKILDDVTKNEQLIKNFNYPHKVPQVVISSNVKENVDSKQNIVTSKPLPVHSNVSYSAVVEISCKKDVNKSNDLDDVKEMNVDENELDASKADEKKGDEKVRKLKDDNVTDRDVKKAKLKASCAENKEQSSKNKLLKEDKAKISSENNDKKKKIEGTDKHAKSQKAKVVEKKSSKDEITKRSKDEKSKTAKPKSETERKASKEREKEKVKSSKEVKTKDSKEDKKRSSSKEGVKSTSKDGKSHSLKAEKTSSKESSKNKSKDSSDAKHKERHKSDKEKSKYSSHEKGSHSHETKGHSTKSKSSHSKSVKTTHTHKSSSSQSSSKSSSKSKEPKKIQDEKISSSSIVKGTNQDIGSLPKGVLTSDLSDRDSLDEVPSIFGDGSSDVDDIELDSSGSDGDTYEECWRIFHEENDTDAEKSIPLEKPEPSPKETSIELFPLGENFPLGGKKRQAHQMEFKRNTKPPRVGEKPKLNPAQVMHNRYIKLQEMYTKQNEQSQDSSSFLSSVNKSVDGTKKRISTMPSSSLIAAVSLKNKMQMSNPVKPVSPDTYVTITKERVAHVPTAALSSRPIIPSAYGSKVPSNVRQRYLNNFIDECLKFCLSEDQAYETALEEEKKAYDRSTNKTIYLSVAANTLNRLRHRAKEGPPMELPGETTVRPTVSSTTNAPDLATECNKTISHEMMLAGPKGQKVTYSIERRKAKGPEVLIKGMLLYNCLSNYLLTEEQLVENGFPLPHPTEAGRVVISGIYANKQFTSNDPLTRICSRCKKTYYVDEECNYVKPAECDYHWGRIYKRRIAGSLEARYMCCQGDAESDGCCVGPGHVFEGSDAHLLKGFVKTLPKSPPQDKYYGVYSLDCEMCYTTVGIELTRVTVIGPDMNPVFETYVRPEHPVLDYNTRFSGISEEDLVGITTTIRDVQAILLCMFNDKTILIGHSLESDFKALKLVHKTVVDTSVVFPHKLGLPFKRALRTLVAEKCNKIIQNSVGGHDSHEDAAACMELMLWKLKEDLKTAGR